MGNVLNIPNCGGTTSTFNSGVPLCDVIRDVPYGLLLVDSGREFTSAEMATLATFVATLKTASRAARGGRVFPIWALTNFEDKSKEPTKGAIGNLTNSEIQLVDGVPSFAFQHRKGDIFHSLLVKAEAGGFTMMIVDQNYVVYGTQTAAGKFTGFSLAEFKAQLPKFQTPQSPSSYPFEVTLASIAEYKENLAFVQCDSTIVGISGLRDVTLSMFSQASNVIKVGITGLGGKNVGALFTSELTQLTAWLAKKVSDGSAFTITSVVWDSVNQVFTVTLDSTTYTALTVGTKLTLDLNVPSVLTAAPINVDGYESTGPITITR